MSRSWARPAAALLAAATLVTGCRTKLAKVTRMRRMIQPIVHQVEGALESPRVLEPTFAETLGVHAIYLDAGHGAAKNPGNTSSFCQEEQEFTRLLGLEVQGDLERTGHFKVTLSREGSELVPYADRIAQAERVGAEAFVSLHSDVRGPGKSWSPSEGVTCLSNVDAPGYVVIYSDEGPDLLVEQRRSLALAVSDRMSEVGFLRYSSSYEGLYATDAMDPSVLVDRHAADKRIFILRRTKMPAVIIETHHALDPREATLWENIDTRRAFAAALAQALGDVLPLQPATKHPVETASRG